MTARARAQLAQQLRRHERAVDREEDRELGRGRAQPGDDARDRRPRLGRLDDDVERQLEVALADREPQRERLARGSASHASASVSPRKLASGFGEPKRSDAPPTSSTPVT